MGPRPLVVAVALALVLSLLPSPAAAVSPSVVISQVYGGGGNSGATYQHDFVELFNRGTTTVSLSGLSLQYASATGTGNFGSNSGQLTELSGSIAPGRYILVREASTAAVGAALPAPDVVDATPINMSGTAGKVALVTGTTSLGCNGGSAACNATALARIIDLVGYGNANFFEGAAAAATLANTTAAIRKGSGCTDTDQNGADFQALTPAPRNSASTKIDCNDAAPGVQSHAPAVNAIGIDVSGNVTVTFSEPVNVVGSWFAITCTTSGAHAAVASGGPQTFTLDPTSDFVAAETCTVTIVAAKVSDQDVSDPPDQMSNDYVWSFSTTDCGGPATLISAVQGSGAASPLVGQVVTVEGVVVGDYQGPGQLSGFYLQEEDADADGDASTSEGVFVFTSQPASVGDVVRVKGTVTEFFSLTEIANVSGVDICDSGASVEPTGLVLPVADYDDFERYEGMLIEVAQTLTVTETFTLARFGEVRLSADGRLYTPTAVTSPGAAAQAVADENLRRSFILDDGDGRQNIDPTIHPVGGLSAANTLRSGYTVTGLSGIFDHRFGSYRVQPVGPVPFSAANPRPAAPATVGGNTRIASFNVLNYFNGDGAGGGFPTSRGASTPVELERQRAKIISALTGIDADIVGLMELENDATGNSAIEDLVAGLNDATGDGTYAFVDTGVIGTDQIRVGLIYKAANVTTVGPWRVIDSTVDPRFIDTRNRPSLAQTFRRNGTTEKFTVVVNHLKSKGSACVGDPDAGDGQGNCNGTRTDAARALLDWIASDPTESGDPDFIVIGDLNSYTFEDPITTLTSGGLVDLVRQHSEGLSAYSYVFDGQAGYLDHALATSSLAANVTGVTEWHINADEPIALDYDMEFKSDAQDASFYAPDAYRSSDHDPIVVGIQARTTLAGLCVLTRDLIPHEGIATSLCAKLDAAADAEARGNDGAKNGIMNAYANEVRAQRGKAIAPSDATILIDIAGGL